MATKEKAPPKQLFITSQKREEHEYPDGDYEKEPVVTVYNFGFMHPHEPNVKTDAKRKHTQMAWAYGYDTVYQNDQGIWYQKGDKGKRIVHDEINPKTGKNRYEYVSNPYDDPIPAEYAPRIWDNVPLSGFKIVDTVNRYRGNKLFKVLDPRGIEFEITVKSLFNLIQTGTVSNGEIMGECIWKHGKNLVFA